MGVVVSLVEFLEFVHDGIGPECRSDGSRIRHHRNDCSRASTGRRSLLARLLLSRLPGLGRLHPLANRVDRAPGLFELLSGGDSQASGKSDVVVELLEQVRLLRHPLDAVRPIVGPICRRCRLCRFAENRRTGPRPIRVPRRRRNRVRTGPRAPRAPIGKVAGSVWPLVPWNRPVGLHTAMRGR